MPVFEALIAACVRVFDHYHWLGEAELCDLRTPLAEVRATAEQVLDEYEKVQALTAAGRHRAGEAAADAASLVRRVSGEAPASTDGWVRQLADLRRAQGHLVTLRELRYVDLARIDALGAELSGELDATARRAVAFLQRDDAFAGYHDRGRAARPPRAPRCPPSPPPRRSASGSTEQADGLGLVTEVVGTLDIADATVRTAILERVGEVLGAVNRARATLDARRRELAAVEGRAGFAAEFALLGQAVTGALAAADTPEAATSSWAGCCSSWRTWSPASASSTTS